MAGRDPSEATRLPLNPRGALQCRDCEEWREADQEACPYCFPYDTLTDPLKTGKDSL